jgi:hypothetical protein
MIYKVETCRFIKHLKDLVVSTICFVTVSDSDHIASNDKRLGNNETERLLKEGILPQFKELFRQVRWRKSSAGITYVLATVQTWRLQKHMTVTKCLCKKFETLFVTISGSLMHFDVLFGLAIL